MYMAGDTDFENDERRSTGTSTAALMIKRPYPASGSGRSNIPHRDGSSHSLARELEPKT